ncbi:MAG: hypothetical protein JWP37_1972 [Mucilaginibacter sp.]|nr:hypothetical protein [Mucilaginibacter sp.]
MPFQIYPVVGSFEMALIKYYQTIMRHHQIHYCPF